MVAIAQRLEFWTVNPEMWVRFPLVTPKFKKYFNGDCNSAAEFHLSKDEGHGFESRRFTPQFKTAVMIGQLRIPVTGNNSILA